jgi:hypothetical protein
MRRPWLALAALSLAVLAVGARAADSPHAGTWKVIVLEPNPRVMALQELSVWLVQIDKEGKKAKVLSSMPGFKGESSKLQAEDMLLRFNVVARGAEFHVVGHVPPGKAKGKVLLGSVEVRGSFIPIRLERTSDKEIDPKAAVKVSPGSEDLQAAMKLTGKGAQLAALRAAVKKHSGKPAAIMAAMLLVQHLLTDKAAAADVQTAAEGYLKLTAPYGPELRRNTLFNLAQVLLGGDKTGGLALEYARRGAKRIKDSDPPELRGAALQVLAEALKKNKKEDELKGVEKKLAKLEEELDRLYQKDAIPFKPEKFKGRAGKSKRVVLVELFTGAQCPPCVAADIAFDALLKTCSPKEAVFLQYHMHAPRADPLTNEDSEARAKYYGDEVEGAPTYFVDGRRVTEDIGGGRHAGKRSYDNLIKRIGMAVEEETPARIALSATRNGDRIDITATVTDAEKKDHNIKLRLALLEEEVRYAGRNGQRLHHHVVRAFPGGVRGFKIDSKEVKQTVRVDLAEVRKKLGEYLAKYAKDNPTDPYTPDRRPLELRKLKVVALVQDEDKSILQAAQVDVPSS